MPSGGGGRTCPVPTNRECAAGSTDDFYRHKLQSVIFIHLFYLSANGGEGRGFDVLGITHSTITEYLNLNSELSYVSVRYGTNLHLSAPRQYIKMFATKPCHNGPAAQ